jgi:predicted ArsR family transcriptional regulator
MGVNPRPETIADPARLSLLRTLAERGEASLSELAEAAGIHANTARPRLHALERAGLVQRARGRPRGRGRPHVRYRIDPEWRLPTADFLGLAELLAAVLLRASVDDERLEAVGRDWGRYLAGRPGAGEPADTLPASMAQLGFDARLARRRLTLRGCPCPLVMPGRPELLCRLATAVANGVLDASGGRLTVTGSAHDPERRVCTVCLGTAGA